MRRANVALGLGLAAWQHSDGRISISINEGVQLLLTKQVRLILAPVDEKQ